MSSRADLAGLTGAQAAQRLRAVGPNRPPPQPRRGLLARVGGQLRDPMILLLLGALVVVLALGDLSDGVIIVAVIVLNTAIGVVQEVRAANAIDALEALSAPRAVVVRDGHPVHVDSADVVPDDVVLLEAGDVIPADALLIDSHGLQVDESAMTGESVPVARDSGDEVLSGTVVTRGRCSAVVQRTGADSGLGRIASSLATSVLRPTPLQQRLARLSRQLVAVTLAVAGLVLGLGVARGEPPGETLVLAVSLAVAAIPESLPAVVTVALALGAFRMARRSALVRWLPAVETLGSVTVLASDKTGTLTEGRMLVQHLWTPAGAWQVSGHGYGVEGVVSGPPSGGTLELLVRDLVLCNDAHVLGPEDGQWRIVGDPLEAALLIAAAKHDPRSLDLASRWARVEEIPFDSGAQRMVTLHRSGDEWLSVCKGAPEVVLDLLSDTAVADRARSQAEALAGSGFRVLAVADAHHAGDTGPDDLERVVVLRGRAAVCDPPRPGAVAVVRACRDAGIRTILITGDHPATARAIADELTISGPDTAVADGAAVRRGEHVPLVDRIAVYARTRPQQKVDIVTAWQERGAVVAMTGDGVNDAPALRQADIGIAMGDRGTEVARQAADLVLADDDLATLVVAVGEGRRIYTNIRMFLRYGLAGGLAEVLVILIGPFLGLLVPLAPGQILWINMITHGVPGVAFGGEPMDPTVMRRPSPSPERSVLGGGLVGQIVVGAVLIGGASLVGGLLAPTGEMQTWVFLTLGLAQLGVALAIRAPRSGVSWRSRGLEAAVVVAAALQVLAVTWPPLQDLLGTVLIGPTDALLVLGLSALPSVVLALQRRLVPVLRGPSTLQPEKGPQQAGGTPRR
jgi:Ca2+-transporting ATPase